MSKSAASPFRWLIATLTTVLVIPALTAAELTGDDAIRTVQAGVPQGALRTARFTDSTIFPGTERDYAVYVPVYRPV